mmetsp:Transcript_34631/g.77429  ORF Transcript_34631/g.77429 Transcript_34631/m.77429 type:complete len:91 (+) Transcript_34631:2341-2613(+)
MCSDKLIFSAADKRASMLRGSSQHAVACCWVVDGVVGGLPHHPATACKQEGISAPMALCFATRHPQLWAMVSFEEGVFSFVIIDKLYCWC